MMSIVIDARTVRDNTVLYLFMLINTGNENLNFNQLDFPSALNNDFLHWCPPCVATAVCSVLWGWRLSLSDATANVNLATLAAFAYIVCNYMLSFMFQKFEKITDIHFPHFWTVLVHFMDGKTYLHPLNYEY